MAVAKTEQKWAIICSFLNLNLAFYLPLTKRKMTNSHSLYDRNFFDKFGLRETRQKQNFLAFHDESVMQGTYKNQD